MIVVTHRAPAVVLLSVVLLIAGILREPSALFAGAALLLFTAALRGYAALEVQVASKLKVSHRVEGLVEGGDLVYEAIIENKSLIPIITAEVAVKYSPHLKLVKGSRAALVVIPPRSFIKYKMVFKARTGAHYIGPLKLVVRDPLGLFKSAEALTIGEPARVEVKPKASEVVVRRLLSYARSSGLTRSRKPGSGVEFYDTRDYVPGDELRSIEWKKLAYMNKLVVKEYERETHQAVIFVVDATPPMLHGPYGSTPFEHSARVVSSMAMYLGKRGDLVAVVAYNSEGVVSTEKLYRGKRAYYEALRALSKVEYRLEGGDEARIAQLVNAVKKVVKIMPRERNAIFVFTTSGSKAYLEYMAYIISRLKALNCSVYVVVPIITAYEIKGVAPWARSVYRVKALKMTKEGLEFARNLRRLGASVIAVGPEHIPQLIVSIVEASAAR